MVDQFHPSLYVACSFQQEESVLLDMLHRIEPDIRIFYLDTDVLFEETYETRDRFVERYGFKFERYHNITPRGAGEAARRRAVEARARTSAARSARSSR